MITCLDLYTTRPWPPYGKAARSGCSVPLGEYFFGEYLWWCTDEAWRDYLRGHRARMTREEWLRIYSEPKLATSGQAVWKGTARRLVEQQSRQRALCLSQQESTRQPVCLPRRRKKNSARHVWSARTPQGRATPGASPAPGAYISQGTAWSRPTVPTPFSSRYPKPVFSRRQRSISSAESNRPAVCPHRRPCG